MSVASGRESPCPLAAGNTQRSNVSTSTARSPTMRKSAACLSRLSSGHFREQSDHDLAAVRANPIQAGDSEKKVVEMSLSSAHQPTSSRSYSERKGRPGGGGMWWYATKAEVKKGRVETKEVSLAAVVADARMLRSFLAYMRALYRDNLILAFRDYHKIVTASSTEAMSVDALRTQAQSLIDRYCREDSETALGYVLSEHTKKEIEEVAEGVKAASTKEEVVKAIGRVFTDVEEMADDQLHEYWGSSFFRYMAHANGPCREKEIKLKIAERQINQSTYMWKEGTTTGKWKKAAIVDEFHDDMQQITCKGQLTPSEIEYLFRWVTKSQEALQMISMGSQDRHPLIRALSYRALHLILRATMSYNRADPIVLGKTFVQFLRKSEVTKEEHTQHDQILGDQYCLLAMLFNPCHAFKDDIENAENRPTEMMNPTRGKVYNPGLWLALLHNINGSGVYPRTKCLQALYYRIVTDRTTALSILTLPRWQLWFLPLAFDLPTAQESASITNMTNLWVGMMVELIWASADAISTEAFARELRYTLTAILAVSAHSSVHLAMTVMSSLASKAQSDCRKWVDAPSESQLKKYRAFYHLVRLCITVAFLTSSRKFGLPDELKTDKCLAREWPEVCAAEAGEAERKKTMRHRYNSSSMGSPRYKNIRHPLTLPGDESVRGSGEAKEFSHDNKGERSPSDIASPSTRRSGHSKSRSVSPMHKSGSRGGEEKRRTKAGITDQEMLYNLKICYHIQSIRQCDATEEKKRLYQHKMSERYLPAMNDAPDRLKRDDSDPLIVIDDARFVLSPSSLQGLLLRRRAELKTTIDQYGDTNHVNGDETRDIPNDRMEPYGEPWKHQLSNFPSSPHSGEESQWLFGYGQLILPEPNPNPNPNPKR
uniref:RGS domain-containing protein n=1 Tax=Lotharella globosa TaxID=91324 RepID=A0A7S4DL28_9EUKA